VIRFPGYLASDHHQRQIIWLWWQFAEKYCSN